MRTNLIIVSSAIMLFAGCASQKAFYLNPELKTFSREELEKSDSIKLPEEFHEQLLKSIVLGLHFREQGNEFSRTLNARLQTELGKLRRFTIVSQYNVNGKMLLMDLADLGEVELKKPSKQYAINYILDVDVKWDDKPPKEDYKAYTQIHTFEAVCDWHLIDYKSKEELDHGVVRGVTERRMFFNAGLSNTKDIIGGFNPNDQDSRDAAKCSAIMKALATVANRIGNRFPVCGEVKAVSGSGERLTMDKGFVDGVGRFQQVAICSRGKKKGSLITPLALAEAMPSHSSSNLHIYRWNTMDDDCAALVQMYRESPKEFAKKHKLIALCYGVPIPVEWEHDSIEDDEKFLMGIK